MTPDKAIKLLKFIDPDVKERGVRALMQVVNEDAGIGIAFTLLGCAYCGEEFILIHKIPITFPQNCDTCGKKQAYRIGELE